jgi:hypothetical protein
LRGGAETPLFLRLINVWLVTQCQREPIFPRS